MSADYLLTFLPYIETLDGTRVETLVPAMRWKRSGTIEEIFNTRDQASARMAELIALGAIERAEIRKRLPMPGMCWEVVDKWDEVSK